ncbi:carbonic anhydrase [Plakobranchus ocellatus]|uniref:Carbonic anhydrase n=1 Tax=Plakobranchus ocellatus TaxID=259542 RepID=A0AAV4AQP0_9GAST|nr:carbonic anhydrase [Plakobranchus ocellatus]
MSLALCLCTEVSVCVLRSLPVSLVTKPYWTYEGPKGVNFWYQDYPKCESTANSAQSPINIVDTEATYQNLQPIVFAGYSESQGIEWELSNNGHSVVASVISGELLIFGGGFSDNYEAAQFHFHWGASSGQGSEHLINGGAYPLELHIVHRGANYKSVSEAAVQPNGLAVLGFMFEISPIDNSNLDPIINNLANIVNPGDKKALPPVTLRDFLPRSLTDFYRYSGSLTTPGCYESVTWTVFRNTIPISESQLQKFRQVKSNDRNQTTNEYMPMVNNFRPVQPINSRVVFANFKLTPDAAVGLRGNLVICSLCLLVLSIFSAV